MGSLTDELAERFDHECICDCPDNQDRHVIAECPNRLPLATTSGDWCAYWFIFWYGVETEILIQAEDQLPRALWVQIDRRERLENFCSTFDVGKPGFKVPGRY